MKEEIDENGRNTQDFCFFGQQLQFLNEFWCNLRLSVPDRPEMLYPKIFWWLTFLER